ncbi:hypothetical protein ES703_75070 [subsurface metagenome]
MTDDIVKEAEGILEKAEWAEFWREYEGAIGIGAWGQAHDLLAKTLLPKLFADHNKMVETIKAREELTKKLEEAIEKYKELAEKRDKVIKHYEKIINEYESQGGQK